MKRLVSLSILSFIVFYSFAQYGNEWIEYNQTYYKIPVAREGLYRLTYLDLQGAGFPVSGDPATFRLFHRGVEQAILVYGESDGAFDPEDYLEFYGMGNDGSLDSTLYEIPDHQPHKFYNLYSDTTSYFLTLGAQTGKRIASFNTAPSGAAPKTHHLSEHLLILNQSFSGGADYGSVRKTLFDEGEGWMGVQILHNKEVTYTLEGITKTDQSSGNPHLEVLLTGRGPMNHNIALSTAARGLTTFDFHGYSSYQYASDIEWTDIDSDGKLSLKVRVTGVGGPDRISVGWIRLTFPRQNDLSGISESVFYFPETSSGPAPLKFDNPPPGVRFFDVTDPASVVLLSSEEADGVVVMAPAGDGKRKIFATASALSASSIKPVVFREIQPNLHNYVIITHPVLRRPAVGYTDPVKAYAEYRALPDGGNFDTLVVNIDQLYDQFNYGESSPRAIFQFMKFLASVNLPDYLFLIGKGLDVNYNYRRNPSAFTSYRDLVPSAGYPASDMAYTAGLSGMPHVAGVATGRLTANNPAEVGAYLNKVVEKEALPFDKLWRKKLMHLSGGIEENEPVFFRDLMRGFQGIAEDEYLGGKVKAVAKQSTDVKLVNIAEEVNAGLGLITFFGHSAPNTLDFDIGWVSDPIMGYNNTGKYPFLLMNGCDAGSFFLNATILGENWIKTPDKGAVGFIAHSSYGLVSGLQRYTSLFYEVAFADPLFIHQPVGKVQQEVARRYLAQHGSSALALSQSQQMVLLGDPAVKIFGAPKPDYAIDQDHLAVTTFNGEPLTAQTDSFKIQIPVHNFGITGEEDIRVAIARQYNETKIFYDSIFPGVLFSDTLTMVIRNTDQLGFGLNTFTLEIDPDGDVDELNETNNGATFEYFIPLNGTRNLYPAAFSIVTEKQIDLSFQYTDLLATEREYLIEIDTLPTFDSEFKQEFLMTAPVWGRQPVELTDKDSLVYYWRTRIAEPVESESTDWSVSSFTYIRNGEEGWAQIHFPQFGRNAYAGLMGDPELRRIQFTETVSEIALKTFSAASGAPRDSVSFKINGVEFNLLSEGGACRNNTLNLAAFDRHSTQPYAGIYLKWYEMGGRRLLCGREPYVINSFTPQDLITGNGDDLVQYVENISVGDSVILFTIGDAGYSQWPTGVHEQLEAFGISAGQLSGLQDGDPLIILGRKGASPGTATILRGASPQPFIETRGTITGRLASGTMASTVIGPALSWKRLHVRIQEAGPSDDFIFTILGIRANNGMDTLFTGIKGDVDISGIDAEEYPHLKLVMTAKDEADLTAIQLKKWLVIYEPVAEGMLFFQEPEGQQTVSEGQPFAADFGFINISTQYFTDSLEVHYALLNAASPGYTPATIRIYAPAPGDTTRFSVPFETVSKRGLNDIDVEVNPGLQPEKYYENNFVLLRDKLLVLADVAQPVLEVTFDGRFLENEDFVSASPVIRLRLWDENQFMPVADTLGMRIFLAYPCDDEGECAFRRVYFARPDLTWEPASGSLPFTVNFSPTNLAAGRYKLRVEATDVAGNTAGREPYEIAFNTAPDESGVSVSPYPNPSTEEVRFQVMVTGDAALPSSWMLQITDLGGKRVMEWYDPQVLHVGKNTLTWNGSRPGGEPLPGGIYFYRVLLDGGNAAGEYYGKLILLR